MTLDDGQILDVERADDPRLGAVLDGVPLVHWARRYLHDGLKPLPKRKGTKFPAIPWEPYKGRPPRPDELTSWFAGDGADGICAVLDGTGFAVLDLDMSGDAARRLLTDAGVDIPDLVPRVITGSGREHLWFRTNRTVGRHIRLLSRETDDTTAAIDVLGEGIVVLPPSVHPDTGQPYSWRPPFLDPGNVPPLPPRIYELIAESARPTRPRLASVDGPIPAGKRERTLTSMLGGARRRGAQEAELRALAEAANQRCQPPLASRDLDRLAHSIARYEPDTLDVEALLATVTIATPTARTPVALAFRTAAEIAQAAPDTVPAVCAPYLLASSVTKLDGPPKRGKTTLRNFLVGCVLRGESCLGYPAPTPAPVVLLTEEPISACLEGLRASGLHESPDLHVLSSFDARAHKWPDIVAQAIERARTVGARLFIVDTPGPFTGFDGDAENFSGTALATMKPLEEATAAGLAVLLLWHDRKAGGEVGESGRGSSAFAGAVDTILALRKPQNSRETVRAIHAVSRFRDVPRELTIERVSCFLPSPEFGESGNKVETFRQLTPGEAADAVTEGAAAKVREALPRTAADAVTVAELATSVGLAPTTVRRALDQIETTRVGSGHRGDPARFFYSHRHQFLGIGGKHETREEATDTMASGRGPPTGAVHRSAPVGSRGTNETNHPNTMPLKDIRK